jgi:hypothetical protein
MNADMMKDRFRVFLATGALAIGFASAAQANMPRGGQVGAEAAGAAGASEEAVPKIEKRIIVTTGEADSDAPAAKQERRVIVRTQGAGEVEDLEADEPGMKQEQIIIRTGDGDAPTEKGSGRQVAWLGLSAEEASDALASQLGLQPGEGLLVTYVATNSPAAKVSLQKNDLLYELDGQKLVLPGQLRKLVQMHKEGDQVVLTYYRGGKKQETTATLGKSKAGLGWFGDGRGLDGLKQLRLELKDLPSLDGLGEHMKELRESLAKAGVDRENIQIEVRRGLDEARKAVAEAIAQVREARHGAHSASKELEDLASGGVEVDKDATVTIKSRNESVRTIVTSDESGTYVIVANPKKRLTAHDKDGKLTFDGEIETSEQQEKVPKEIWKKVVPMIEQLKQSKDNAPAAPEPPPKKTSTRPAGGHRFHSFQMLADLRTLGAMIEFLLDADFPVPAVPGTNSLAVGTSTGQGT